MADSRSEQVLRALFDRVKAAMPAGVVVVRNDSVPVRLPPAGWVCVRDGDPGPPEVQLSPLAYIFEHEAEIDIVLDAAAASRDAKFDAVKVALGVALAGDRTLGGLCDWVVGQAPVPVDVMVEDGPSLKAATVGVLLTYVTSDPLA